MATQEKKGSLTWKTLVLVVIAAAFIGLGFFVDLGEYDNDRTVKFAAQISVSSVLDEHPESVEYFLEATEILDAAVRANDGDIDILAAELTDVIDEGNPTTQAVMAFVLDRLAAIQTETVNKEEVIKRIAYVSDGIKAAIAAHSEKASDNTTE